MTAETKFNKDGYTHRTNLYDHQLAGKADYGGSLNFSAYRQGRDRQYLGVNGRNYYAKPWGNDSSNVQAVLNGPAYWKRVYYRENIAARFAEEDAQAAAKKRLRDEAEANMSGSPGSSGGGMRKSQSDPGLAPIEPVKDNYAHIKETMKPYVEKQGKPRIRAMQPGERFTFFNTLGNKYHMKAGGKNMAWNVSTETHRSSKNELNWILSNYFRTDTQAILNGAGGDESMNH
mmetsp:Transcript_55073/g.98250  ORF Transcript_55073/g.98250 Transcript_55073/m.98250 type:complete len:231 (-) Transcript_55073:45-737(-)|eukprot:CAMPEP_0197649432 /NCGR_PEP_ID=MMETSP1338-20131121/28348_1 /TAXON_ID=43686 ORGANISM="Pelagodinium beii, Strain RCC1491" /NCGR_SAMPLE_ID=MMETSP1338 /ASSEMBLY_ACC=CAM_ASM_000754 /LENGTH=230 /DNA_ID=CAMNT_0043223607 /DNA_START=98 /DNA_END=790 /DNA_ORIENTATION=-